MQKVVHYAVKRFEYEICEKSYFTGYEDAHLGQKKFKCEIC